MQEELCNQCGLCVDACPGEALRYARRFIGASPEEQKALLKVPTLLHLYQAQFIGFQYTRFKCMAACPAFILIPSLRLYIP
ncbi:MAG: 4Fe-4S binding protein [Deltaproteobacteria bacterium]|nr:MAG: 4Fe-4S binding protein [Deltaproteobacteria bacterium]